MPRLGNIAQIEEEVGRDLVVAAASRVESARDVDADDLPQARLDVHMDVLEGRIERERAVFDLSGNFREALDQRAFVLGRDQTDSGEHPSVRGRASQIEAGERPIEVDRSRESLHGGVGLAFESASPELFRSLASSGTRR
jgi:hypothetical protein